MLSLPSRFLDGWPMATFLFWNINGKDLRTLIREAVDEHQVDVLMLAECSVSPALILNAINDDRDPQLHFHPTPLGTSRVTLYSVFPSEYVTALRDEPDVSARRIRHPLGGTFLLFLVHLGSRRFLDAGEQASLAVRLREVIESVEAEAGHDRSILVGDLNMDPFEDGVVGSEQLHGVMTRSKAAEGSRKVSGKDRKFFYNPMWRCIGKGRDDSPHGTYYYSRSSPTNQFWHVFDQLLIRPSLLNRFNDESLHILARIGERSLVTSDERIDRKGASDHLPILFSINLATESTS